MFDKDYWSEIWLTLSRNRTRSLLACFGVFWGILILVILLGLCEGVKNGINLNVSGIATNSCFFIANPTGESYKGFNRGRTWKMRDADIEKIKGQIKGVEFISPVIFSFQGKNNIKYNSLASSFHMKGIYPDYFHVEKNQVEEGRLINQIDNANKRKVCVIGTTIRDAFFHKDEIAMGKYLNIEGVYYQIVGIIKARSSINIAGNPNDAIFVPYHTMQQTKNLGDEFKHLCITVKEGYSSEQLFSLIKTLLKKEHQLSPADEQAIGEVNVAKQFERFNNIYLSIRFLTWVVGLGTLLAGIIGINNIMLITVKDRTQEIGIRRALGAKPIDIVLQILSESILMSAISGIISLTIGVNILFFIDLLLSQMPSGISVISHPVIKLEVAIFIFVFLIICGLIAGLLPSLKGMTIKPIEAIQED